MKKSVYSIGGIIILLFAAFVFVLVPALAGQSDASSLPEYGSYNGVPIKFEEGTEFYQLANQAVQRMQQQGYDFNQEYSSFYYSLAFTQAFNQVVGPMALRDMTASTGFIVPETWLERALIERYYNEAGNYSQAAYNATPDKQKRENQEQTTKELEAQRSYEDLFGTFATLGKAKLYGLKASSAEIEFIRKMGEDLHGFEYVAFDMRQYPDEKTKEFAEANKDKFAKYDLTVITLDDEAKAKDVIKRLSNSEITFDDAVTSYSTKILGNSDTGKVTQNRRHQIAEQFKDEAALEKVLALSSGATSEAVELNNGWAIFRCDGEAVPSDTEDTDELRAVNSYIFSHEKGLVEDYYNAIANDFIAAAATSNFDEACAKFEKTKGTIAPFALNYNNTTLVGRSSLGDTADLSGATTNENFLKSAFSLKQGELSAPLVLSSSNNIVVLRCSEIEKGGTSAEDAPRLIGDEITNADAVVVNSAIQASPKIKSNSGEFMAKLTGRN